MAKVTGKAYDFSLLKRIFRYVSPYKNIFTLSVTLTILLAALSPTRPFLIQYTVDHFILNNNQPGLIRISFLMLGLLLIQTVVQYYHTFLTNKLGQSTIKGLRIDVFNHISRLRLNYFDRTPIGQLITRSVSDLETIADIFSEGLIMIIGDILQLVALIAVMTWTDWKLTLIVLCPMPLLILATYIFKESIKSAFQEVRAQVSHLNTFLQEHITGMNITQYFAKEDQEMYKFKIINSRHRDAHIRSNWYYSIFYPVVEIISAMSIGLLVWFGSKSILEHNISPGVVMAFIMYINMMFRPIRELADKFNTLQMGMVGAERIFSVLDTHEEEYTKGKISLPEVRGKIEFDGVWFAYNEEKWVLKGINFEVNPGETLALVGATGAGKSSIINLLNRFYAINKGSIKLDGVDIRDFDLQFLRSQIGTVIQDVFLFSDTIKNNISLNNPEISEEQIISAAKEAGADTFIRNLPGGYDYNVMERGSTLSAGQAQLISFIRAMVYNPKILVLDEATSSVDTETEYLIQQTIQKLMKGRTSIVIAHRLSTIQNADKIIVLDHGEIKEIGSHQELLKQNGHYKRLYDLQFNSTGIEKRSTSIQ
ncbi:ABC transporter ATP-binding protein [Desertivirga brevis]|uniref:ABC transporter ATP-binding protein n=1 Tax=Desertivirga brevis TaxID=2810310 RepID=UPI001A956E78|nr:ABC transporter ATP-binding protein [Pedobacter sp. SYSU D00873]